MKKITYLLLPIIPLAIFILFTILVRIVDVTYINDIGFIGFSTLNFGVNDFVKTMNNDTFHLLTNVLLFFSFATLAPFVIMGLVQFIVRKGLKKVDPYLYHMAAGYVASVALYFIFEIVKINYSPLSTPTDIKPSYPSSHLFLFASFMFIGAFGLFHYVPSINKTIRIVILSGVGALSILMFVLRLFSGHHYLTDLIGGALLATTVVLAFYSLSSYMENNKDESKEEVLEAE